MDDQNQCWENSLNLGKTVYTLIPVTEVPNNVSNEDVISNKLFLEHIKTIVTLQHFYQNTWKLKIPTYNLLE